MFTDTHCHIYDEYYEEGIDSIYEKMEQSKINRVINNGCDAKSNKEVIELLGKYNWMYGAIGIHPESADTYTEDDLKYVEEHINDSKVVAIGEIGLEDLTDLEIETFKKQLIIADETDSKVIIHTPRKNKLDGVAITGGEPLQHVVNTINLINNVRDIAELQGISPKIYVYTSIAYFGKLINIIRDSDGVVLTPHSKKDIESFVDTNKYLLTYPPKDVSLRLNLFPDIKEMLPKDIDLSLWKVKDIKWVENCPVPEGEDFRRIANLW